MRSPEALATCALLLFTSMAISAQQHEAKHLPDGRVVEPPVLLQSAEPNCPADKLSQRRHERKATAYLIIPVSGIPEGVKVIHSAGNGFDARTIEAVQKYIFRPATIQGEPVKVDLYLNVVFHC